MLNFENVKNWMKKHKGKIVIGVISIVGIGLIGLLKGSSKIENDSIESVETKEIDHGRELNMEFRTTDGELLGKIGCYESYMDSILLDEYGEDYRKSKDEA